MNREGKYIRDMTKRELLHMRFCSKIGKDIEYKIPDKAYRSRGWNTVDHMSHDKVLAGHFHALLFRVKE